MHFSKEPAPQPEDANRQPPLNMEPLPVPAPANPTADISDSIAAEKAINAVARYRESSPNVIKSTLMSYREALKLGLEPITVADDDELANTLVRVVEMTGNFKVKIPPFRQQGGKDSLTYTKADVILRTADVQLVVHLFAD